MTRNDFWSATTTVVYGLNSQSSAWMSSPLNSATNFSSLMPWMATTAFFSPPSLPTSTSCSSRFSPLASLLGFFTQNLGLGNLENRNSFAAGGLPEKLTLPSTVPPAHDSMGTMRNASAPKAKADNVPTFFIAHSSLLESYHYR